MEVDDTTKKIQHSMNISLDQYIVENNIRSQVFPYLRKKKNNDRNKKKNRTPDLQTLSLDEDTVESTSNSDSNENPAPLKSVERRLGRNGGRVTKSYREREEDSFSINKGAFRYNLAAVTNPNPRRHSGLVLNIERAAEPSNVTSKALEQVLSNAIRNAMNPIQKVSPVFTTPAINCQPMFMTPAPLTLSGQQPGFSGYFNQKPAPKYNMGLQKEISQIQNKPFAYTCGAGTPNIVSCDGKGLEDASTIVPSSTKVSMNCRFS